MLVITLSRGFLVLLVFFFDLTLNVANLLLVLLSVFLFCYGEGQKGYRCYDHVNKKLYISLNIMFLKHILFYSIPSNSSSVSKFNLTCIDPFCDSDVSGAPLPTDNSCRDDSSNSLNIGSQLIDASSVPTIFQDAHVVADPSPRYPQQTRKPTQ